MLSERLAIYLCIHTCMHGRSQFLTKQPDLLTRTPYSGTQFDMYVKHIPCI